MNNTKRDLYKVKGTDILAVCNWKHPSFGVFADFLAGLLDKEGYLLVEAEPVKTNCRPN